VKALRLIVYDHKGAENAKANAVLSEMRKQVQPDGITQPIVCPRFLSIILYGWNSMCLCVWNSFTQCPLVTL